MKTEKEAKDFLRIYLETAHTNCVVKDCGLFLNIDHPFLGASPDSLMNCDCCNNDYVIEVKCPYKCVSENIIDVVHTDRNFCMEMNADDGNFYLKRKKNFQQEREKLYL